MQKISKIITAGIFCVLLSGVIPTQISAQKYVGIFYSCWANLCLNTTYGDDVYIMGQTPYSPYPEWNWWGKPLYAATHGDGTIRNNYRMYFDTPDNPNNDLIDWHAELLSSANVDYIALDLTNGTQTEIINGAKAVCKRYQERMNEGLPSPQIVFWVQDSVCLQLVENEIFNVYQDNIFFEYLGKKLVNVAGGNIQPAIPEDGIFGRYTCRRMWGLDLSGSYWQFKVNSVTPPPPFYFNGEPEQMCAPVATQATTMTNNGVSPTAGAVGRQNGDYFVKYMDAAIAADVKFIFIHSWNEWTAQNFGTPESPMFVDQWKAEYSSDIEPVDGEHGWQYYELMRQKIAEFKNISNIGDDSKGVPGDFIVEQNYPNPFNPETRIRFSTVNDGFVKIIVYNLLGQEIKVLLNESLNAGLHEVKFNAENVSGGTYFYRIEADNRAIVKKMVLLK